jgi:hypothetical protein
MKTKTRGMVFGLALIFIIGGVLFSSSKAHAANGWNTATVVKAGMMGTYFYVYLMDENGSAFPGGSSLIKAIPDAADKVTIAVVLTAISSGSKIWAYFDPAVNGGRIFYILVRND